MMQVPEITEFTDPTSFLPRYADIPKELKSDKHHAYHVAEELFFSGGRVTDFGYKLKEGLDQVKVTKAIRCVMQSWNLSSEHKFAGMAYLISQWYERT